MSWFSNEIRLQQTREYYLTRLLKPALTSERARIITGTYQKHEETSPLLRRAYALKDILEQMTIYIQPWELLAGNLGPEPVSAPIFPEGGVDFILEELESYETRPGDKFAVSNEVKTELRRLLPWWKGKTLRDHGLTDIPERILEMRKEGLFSAENMLTCGTGHFLPDYALILRNGFSGLHAEAEAYLKNSEQQPESRLFYESLLIITRAVRDFANRYADLAESLAETEDAARSKELKTIAENCRNVPWNAPDSFEAALQSIWMTHVICYIDSNGYGVTLGRIASMLQPYYARDIASGRLDKAHAVNLLISFFFKTNDILKLYNNAAAGNYGGFPVGQPVQLGGLTWNGEDDTDELSFLFLEAEKRVHLYQPDIGLLWTEKMDPAFYSASVALVAENSKPKFFNYHIGSRMYLEAGLPEETALSEWAFIGCVEYGVQGKTWTWADAALINLGKCLELTLNNGRNPLTGKQLGPATGEPEELSDFSLFMQAFQAQLSSLFSSVVEGVTCLQEAHRELWPEPYESLLVQGCMESGRDVNNGGAVSYHTGVQMVGFGTVCDSISALKTFVYEKQQISLDNLVKDLNSNFTDAAILRQTLLNRTDRFGSDSESSNTIALNLFNLCCDAAAGYRDIWDGLYTVSLYSLTSHVGFGKMVGATPDGRKATEPLSDASSPSQYLRGGEVTSVLSSQAKLPHHKAVNGTLLNMKLNKSLITSRDGQKNLEDLIRTYFRLGGFHIQFNVIDPSVLKDAQKSPEKYPDLLIRVAAYVTNWHQLSREVQDEIISRAEMSGF